MAIKINKKIAQKQPRGSTPNQKKKEIRIGSRRDDFRGHLLCELVSKDANNQFKEKIGK